ncbi:MAG: thiazole synthase, partial [Planctomycetota bacterium]
MELLKIANKEFESRLFVGTGKFASNALMADAIAAIDPTKYQLLPNTSGARDAEEAIRLSRLARAASGIEWVKLEVTPDPYYLLPDGEETLKAAQTLVKDGFIVLPYINADPILAKKLQDAGCATVMPLASPIGSNQGMKTKASIEIIIEQATVPVVVDAGLG